jgi:processive 1,2-diacylglycerol beta-glucosyltransferase
LKRILILTAGPGEGRNVAAHNLETALARGASRQARVEVLDLIDEASSGLGERLRHPFQTGAMASRETLRDLLRSAEPDVVVSTHSAYGSLIGEIYREGRKRDFVLISVVCEASVSDSPWAQTPGDFFVVADEAAARGLAARGVPAAKIRALGFPVLGPIEGKKRPTLSAGVRPRVLCLLNSMRRKAPKLLDRLLAHREWDVTVVTDDPELRGLAMAYKAFEVVGDLAKIPALLATHHVVIARAETGTMREAIVAGCPLVVPRVKSVEEQDNLELLRRANAGAMGEKPREVVDWLERAFRDEARLLALWVRNLQPLGRPHAAEMLARFVLERADSATVPVPRLHPVDEPAKPGPVLKAKPVRRAEKKLLMCDFHTHTTWSDGKLTVPELVDFYGQRGFDCLCVTDHLCDPQRLLGKLINLTGLVIPPRKIGNYFAAIEREKKRAWEQYKLLLMAGIEFNKDGYTSKSSTHLLGVDLKAPIDPTLDLKALIAEIHAQDGLAIASHPHEVKSEWGKNTLYLWEHVDDYAPLLDAWEVANRDDIFNPVGLKKLPFIASSDFHKPKHIYSWKTLLYCEKEPEAIKHCIRVNRDVSLTLYRDHRFGLEERVAEADAAPLLVQGS